jgi:hypothetical protein
MLSEVLVIERDTLIRNRDELDVLTLNITVPVSHRPAVLVNDGLPTTTSALNETWIPLVSDPTLEDPAVQQRHRLVDLRVIGKK